LTRVAPDLYSVLVKGEVKAVDRVTRVTLRTPAGETEIAYSSGFFLVQLPNSTSSGALPPGGPYVVVAYDAAGNEVATEKLETLEERLGKGSG